MRVIWKGVCARCGELLFVKPRETFEQPPATLIGMVKCDVHGHPTPISWRRIRLVIEKDQPEDL